MWTFGFGKAKSGGSGYPAIFVVGFVNQVGPYTYGLWRSDDGCSTWKKISNGYPAGVYAGITAIDGDNNTYGTVYVGVGGASILYGTLD